MDGLTLLGLMTAFLAIIFGQMLEGGDIHSLMNLPALFIVVGGTLGAVMIQTPLHTFLHAFRILPWIFRPPKQPYEKSREQLIEMARKSRQFGLLSLEEHLEREKNPLMRQGLELLVVGVDKQNIRQVLESEIERCEDQDLRAAHVFESMGGYSPTIGILGAVLGLIQVMRNLAEPHELGHGIAVAFVATIYGVGLANLVFLPVANKIKSCIANRAHHDEMIVEGMVSMASGESPNMLNLKLNNYGQRRQDERKKK
ncbi:flagellar motor protein [Legionella micdadei]|uniref:Chemotaxis protein MotA n=1 Tax=Legionella micdadei TaxID=451 RepID=A0A098GD61_LEGMI|nr:flagellar motor protein [Legionella micdadei]ARG97959.1 flagellar motor protein [Legionella micdadei]ARG99722.1 flagellar motor protein [Legionella micdadei]KTD30244.1 flagellar motor protein [Legionella micdadei]NSL19214.1 flagellar motor protein [Legionella micdadei]CEG60419.1 Flagellar motor protein MotA [Legionella micdadei]